MSKLIKNIKSFIVKILTGSDGNLSSKRFLGMPVGFAGLGIVLCANWFYAQGRISTAIFDRVESSGFNIMVLGAGLLGLGVAEPLKSAIKSFIKR